MLMHPRETLPLSLPMIPFTMFALALGPSHPRRTSAYVRRPGASGIKSLPVRPTASECFSAFSAFSIRVPVLIRVYGLLFISNHLEESKANTYSRDHRKKRDKNNGEASREFEVGKKGASLSQESIVVISSLLCLSHLQVEISCGDSTCSFIGSTKDTSFYIQKGTLSNEPLVQHSITSTVQIWNANLWNETLVHENSYGGAEWRLGSGPDESKSFLRAKALSEFSGECCHQARFKELPGGALGLTLKKTQSLLVIHSFTNQRDRAPASICRDVHRFSFL
ncbi:hypothetical protein IV203_000833 [Nitzschia inconspicua]|uniref:Uncharacterized protein n=1 Tax=Nitzschia inconspicua TaxID=303405 RepID=A0A9K3L636_9STRA|nr:hypothetical protein IV203_000833 [Nitzschia inconspicua]